MAGFLGQELQCLLKVKVDLSLQTYLSFTKRCITIIFPNSWPSRARKKTSVGIFEYILASMLKVYLDVF